MKIDRLETHDRLIHFKKDQEATICQGVEDCLKKNPYSLALQDKSPYIYIFSHPRTHDDGVRIRYIWAPRLSKPLPQTNSYLFRATSKTDNIEVCWLLPPREMWPQYKVGNVTESDLVIWSIDQFENNRKNLGKKDREDFSDEKILQVYREINYLSKPKDYVG